MTQEEKARCYDEAIERAKKWYIDAQIDFKKSLETLFPELKESEDERIRKGLINYFNDFTLPTFGGLNPKKILAWLEKQGDISPTEDELEALRIAAYEPTKNWSEKLQSLYEKIVYCEYKPADKVEPKFRVGDIIHNKKEEYEVNTIKISEIKEDRYISGLCYLPFDKQDEWELVEQKPAFEMKTPEESLGISSEEYNKIVGECIYGDDKPTWSEEDERIILAISQLLKDCESENGWNCVYSNDKEIFFADIENYLQSLKNRIVPQPKQKWSEEDEDIINKILCICYDFEKSFEFSPASTKVIKEDVDKIDNWLKSFKDRVQLKQEWSEDDEKIIEALISLCDEAQDNIPQLLVLKNWLKSIKDRVIPQPKQEWSEEDNIILSRIIADYERSNEEWFKAQNSLPHGRKITWLKSLKDRYTWKPSDDQMEVLNWCKPLWNEPKTKAVLESLIEDLKKLREE